MANTMINPSVVDLLKKVEDRYSLVMVTSKTFGMLFMTVQICKVVLFGTLWIKGLKWRQNRETDASTGRTMEKWEVINGWKIGKGN